MDTTHWILPTGSDIAYTIIHADLNKKLYPVIYLHEGQAAILPDQILKHSHRLHKMVMMFISTTRLEAAIQTRLDDIKQYTVSRHINDLREIIKKIGAEK